MDRKRRGTGYWVQGAMIAALYAVLTLAFAPISFGPVQFRISEALVILPCFTAAAVPGVFVGCFLANLLGGSIVLDVVAGSFATLLGAIGTRALRKRGWLASLPPIAANTILIPWVLRLGYGYGDAVWWMMVTVGLGEVLSVGVLGNLLRTVLERQRAIVFDTGEG